jgi:predicted AlkP superfamily pyrophosphatase or phosphodiesterase
MTSVIMILIDAFSINYLSKKNTPFLSSLQRAGRMYRLESLFAFRGIEATIFTGRYPEDHRVWTELCLKQTEDCRKGTIKGIKNGIVKRTIKLVDHVPSDRVIRNYRYIVQKYLLHEGPFVWNCVPVNLLGLFELAQSKPVYEAGAIGEYPTLFDVMRRNNVKFNYLAPPRVRTGHVLGKIARTLEKDPDYDFWYFKLDLLDPVGHAYGPRSDQLRHALKVIDEQIKRIFTAFTNEMNDVHFIVLSDHGMSSVNHHFNILAALKKLPLKMGEDYAVFIDSTMARFWFSNERSRDVINNALSTIACGNILSAEDFNEKHLGIVENRYGELVFGLKEHWVFHPDFFHKYQMQRGMHGYADTRDSPMILVYPHEEDHALTRPEAQMVDIMPTVCSIFNITPPPQREGKCLN